MFSEKNARGLSAWLKFISIIYFVMAVPVILLGIPFLLAFGLGLIYFAIGGVYIYLGITASRAANQALALTTTLEGADSVKTADELLGTFLTYFKTLGILMIAGLVMAVLGVIAFFTLTAAFSNSDFKTIIEDAQNKATSSMSSSAVSSAVSSSR